MKILSVILCTALLFVLPYSGAMAAATQSNKLNYDDVQHFTKAIAYIKKYYVKNVADRKMLENAIRGMLKGLDPHSQYLDMDEYKNLRDNTRGAFGGLGIEVTLSKGMLKVVTPLDDTPAYKAGIKAGDLIAEVDGKPIYDLTLRESIKLMRGKKGTPVTLTIIREKQDKPLKIKIIRDIIKIQSVKSRLLEDGYGYVRITNFQAPTAGKLIKALKKLEKENKSPLKGLVLDLRNNPGGLLSAAVDVSDAFLDSNQLHTHNKRIVYTKGRVSASKVEAKASAGDILHGAPLIVLVNQGSASASEIVAGALQDYKRAVIIGQNSFGKGSVQTLIPLDGKRGMKLTTALYYTPSGREIQANGIKPDILVERLTLAKEKTDAIILQRIKEADLKGHLGKTKGKLTDKQAAAQNRKLAKDDIELYQALLLLKAMHFTNANITKHLLARP